jgi:RNA polymerase sigma factor (TIGR02999 family)
MDHASGEPLPVEKAPVTQFLRGWDRPDAESAGSVVAAVYAELRIISSRLLNAERPGHVLQPTALVNELFLRLAAAQPPEWRDRAHFFAVAAGTLRRILIDHARARRAARRGGGEIQAPLDLPEPAITCSYDDLLAIDEALTALEQAEPRAARVSELRFFAGFEESEIAEQLGVSEITVKRDWRFARAWLAAYLARERNAPRESGKA